MLWSPELVCSFSFLCADFFLKPFVIYCLPLPIKFPQPISLVYTLFSLWFLYNWDSFRIDISHSWPVWSHWTGVRGRENQVHGICFRKILLGLDWCVLSECSFFTWPSNSVHFICVSREYTITYAQRKWNVCFFYSASRLLDAGHHTWGLTQSSLKLQQLTLPLQVGQR